MMMDSTEKRQRNFVGYEYKEVFTESGRFSFLLDGYENFGWELERACLTTERAGIRFHSI